MSTSTTDSYTHLDALLADIPSLRETPVSLRLNLLSGAHHTSLSAVNRIMSPLDSVKTMGDLSEALHHIERNASQIGIFREFQVNLPQIEQNGEALDIVLDVHCEEMNHKKPKFDLGHMKRGALNDLDVKHQIYWRNVLQQAETLGASAQMNLRGAWELGLEAHLPLVDYQGIKELNLNLALGQENMTYNTAQRVASPRWWWKRDPQTQNLFAHLQLQTVLLGKHHLEFNLKKRFTPSVSPLLNSLHYRYFWDSLQRDPITNRAEKGIYSQVECALATFNSSPRFVKTQFTSNAYLPLKMLSSVASLHFNVGGLQPLNTNYSGSDFRKLNEKIHPMDRLYTSVRGYNSVGEQKTTTAEDLSSGGNLTQHTEPMGSNFAINVEGRLSAPLKMLGLLYDMTKIHGQAFVQVGNAITMDFEKGDIERAQTNLVQTAKASYGIGFFILMQNLRFELNYCRKLKVWNQAPVDSNFSAIQLRIETEF